MGLAPNHTLHLGLAYSWFLNAGILTARWDYYWRDKSHVSQFNHPGGKLPSWEQHNASLAFATADNRWSVSAWVRNIEDEDNLTSRFLVPDLTRVFYLTEPRLFGVSLRYNFAAN